MLAPEGFFTAGATGALPGEACGDDSGLADGRQEADFAKTHFRPHNRRELIPLIEDVSSTRPARHWVEALERAGVPCGLLQTYDLVFNDPHLLARGFFPDAPHSRLGPVKQIASPMRLSETPTRMARAGPMLGEHSAEVLAELGYSREEIGKLARAGVIREPA